MEKITKNIRPVGYKEIDMKEYDWEKVDDDIGYTAGAKDVFRYIQPFIDKTLYDKMYNEFFRIYATAVYKAIAKNLCIEKGEN